MKHKGTALRPSPGDAEDLTGRVIRSPAATVNLADLIHASSLGTLRSAFRGRSVLVLTKHQLPAALALIELQGLARRLVICPPDLRPEHRAGVIAGAEVDAIVTDLAPADVGQAPPDLVAAIDPKLPPTRSTETTEATGSEDTEWVMLTSGTTGIPKMVVHSFAGLTGAITARPPPRRPPVWGTFYDIRRYGGLQIFLRAILGTGSLVLSQAGEPVETHLLRLATAGVTHLSGTPTHWRRVLMSPDARLIRPDYIRLSGEIADQAILDNLRRTYPKALIGHAYASTEAGVGFEVEDGLEGFPASFLDREDGAVRMKVVDGSLRIRSTRTASRYLGRDAPALADADGFVDTDDIVAFHGDRCRFAGRRSGVINVGGLKVHPEEVEAVINRHGSVRMSLVKARTNPITGAIVVADVVLNEDPAPSEAAARQAALKDEILKTCREALPHHKVPVLLRFAPGLAMTPAGKLDRAHA